MPSRKQKSSGISQDSRSIVVALFLIFLSPVGVVLMWAWTNWPGWIKILLTLISLWWVFAFMGLFGWGLSIGRDQGKKCNQICQVAPDKNACISQCNESYDPNPKIMTSFNPDDLFTALNRYRDGRGSDVYPLKKDDDLCAYAQKLADQYKNTGENPEKILSRDLKNPTINSKYFSNFKNIYQQFAEVDNFSTHELPYPFRQKNIETNYPLTEHSKIFYGCFAVIPSNTSSKSIVEFVAAQ